MIQRKSLFTTTQTSHLGPGSPELFFTCFLRPSCGRLPPKRAKDTHSPHADSGDIWSWAGDSSFYWEKYLLGSPALLYKTWEALTVVAYSFRRPGSLILIFYCLAHLRQVHRLRFRSMLTKMRVLPSSDLVPIPDQVPCSVSRTRFRVSPAWFRVSQSKSPATLGSESRIGVSQQQQRWILCWCVQCLSAPQMFQPLGRQVHSTTTRG